MGIEGDLNLSNEQLDALKEIGNVGAGNSATALGQMIEKKISIDVPQVKILPLAELSEIKFLQELDDLSIIISLRILGKLNGGMLVLFPLRSALLLIDILSKRQIGSTEIFVTEDESVLTEISHIICCSYLNAVGEFLSLHQLIPSIRETSIDKVERLTKIMIKKFVSDQIHSILPIENHLKVEDIELDLLVIFLLEPPSLQKILNMVGL